MRKGAVVIILIFLGLLIFFSLLPVPIFNYNKFPGEDKILHFLIYMCGGMILEFSFKSRKNLLHWLLFAFFILFPALNEYYQSFIPERDGSIKDFLSSAFGFLIGALEGWLILIYGKIKSESDTKTTN